MHDVDQTLGELETDFDSMDADEYGTETTDQYFEMEDGSPISEPEEMELAGELVGVSDGQEMDQFLGGLVKKIGKKLKTSFPTIARIARPLGSVLKGVAKTLLPVAAGAAGTFFGGPAGGALASKLGSMVSSAMEMELEGQPLNQEDYEFEAARRFVRIAGTAAKNALNAPAGIDPQTVARNAVVSAVKLHVPSVPTGGLMGAGTRGQSGRWVRRGNRIVIYGA